MVAFEELVRTYQADIYRFASYLTHDRVLAEDVTQESFLRAFRFIRSFRGETRFGSWLYAITRNCARDALRRHDVLPLHDAAEQIEHKVSDPTSRAELDAALASISADHRESFLLIEVFGLSYQEASDVLGVRVGTLKSRMFRARQALCRALALDEAARGET